MPNNPNQSLEEAVKLAKAAQAAKNKRYIVAYIPDDGRGRGLNARIANMEKNLGAESLFPNVWILESAQGIDVLGTALHKAMLGDPYIIAEVGAEAWTSKLPAAARLIPAGLPGIRHHP